MHTKQQNLKEQRDVRRGRERLFDVGDKVFVKTVRGESASWEEGVVRQVVSAVTYVVKVREQLRFTHADHLRPRHADPTPSLNPKSGLGHPLTPHSDVTEEKSPAAGNSARTSVPDKLVVTDPTPPVQQAIPPVNVNCPTELAAPTSQTEARSASTDEWKANRYGAAHESANHRIVSSTKTLQNKLTKC
ncbi:hypothetical protein MTO96_029770 [Rhipicephalus appendiculatus]